MEFTKNRECCFFLYGNFVVLFHKIERSPRVSPNVGSSPFIPADPVPSLTGVADEYEPLRPNDYEDFVKKRKEQRQKEREEDLRRRDPDEDRHSR